MDISFQIGWESPGLWRKHGHVKTAWYRWAWFGIEFNDAFTMGFRLLGFCVEFKFGWY